jgi:FtsP/CotA-like multicopper oxidase with cupredoxin domain
MYEFTLRQHGTFMYHSHHDEMTQMGMGMTGMFVIHPRNAQGPRPDRDFALMLHEWAIEVGAERPDPNEMTDFNVLTINAKAFPGTAPLIVKFGDKVRIRIGNCTATTSRSLRRTAARSLKPDSGQRPRFLCQLVPPERWSSLPTIRAIGRCTVT